MLDVQESERRKESGGVTVVILGVILVVLLLFLGITTLVGAVVAKQKAQGAADILAIESAKRYFSESFADDERLLYVCPTKEAVDKRFEVFLEECLLDSQGNVRVVVSAKEEFFSRKIQAAAVAGRVK